jgi:hypothetical protein
MPKNHFQKFFLGIPIILPILLLSFSVSSEIRTFVKEYNYQPCGFETSGGEFILTPERRSLINLPSLLKFT